MRGRYSVILAWVLFLGILTAVFLSVRIPGTGSDDPVTVVCMQTVEDADATLLRQGETAVLIDAGTEQDGKKILEVLKEQGISHLDYMILSHPDKDHIGGAMQVLSSVSVGRVVQPYYTGENEELEEVKDFCQANRIPILYPNHTRRLRAGRMQLLVYPPLERHYSDTNNYSLAVLVRHGNVSMMFAGDALKKRSQELLYTDWPEVDLYKVPHHGRANSMTGELFSAFHPLYAVVTAETADSAVVKAADSEGCRILYTMAGDCIFESDGTTLYLREEGGKPDAGGNEDIDADWS